MADPACWLRQVPFGSWPWCRETIYGWPLLWNELNLGAHHQPPLLHLLQSEPMDVAMPLWGEVSTPTVATAGPQMVPYQEGFGICQILSWLPSQNPQTLRRASDAKPSVPLIDPAWDLVPLPKAYTRKGNPAGEGKCSTGGQTQCNNPFSITSAAAAVDQANLNLSWITAGLAASILASNYPVHSQQGN